MKTKRLIPILIILLGAPLVGMACPYDDPPNPGGGEGSGKPVKPPAKPAPKVS